MGTSCWIPDEGVALNRRNAGVHKFGVHNGVGMYLQGVAMEKNRQCKYKGLECRNTLNGAIGKRVFALGGKRPENLTLRFSNLH